MIAPPLVWFQQARDCARNGLFSMSHPGLSGKRALYFRIGAVVGLIEHRCGRTGKNSN